MKNQKNIRLDESALLKIKEIASEFKCSDTEVIERAIWTLVDVLYEGDSYYNHISSLKQAVISALR